MFTFSVQVNDRIGVCWWILRNFAPLYQYNRNGQLQITEVRTFCHFFSNIHFTTSAHFVQQLPFTDKGTVQDASCRLLQLCITF